MPCSHEVKWRLQRCGRNAATYKQFAAETNARNSTIPLLTDPGLRVVSSPTRSAGAAADWPTARLPSGPATHKHVPRPLENKTTGTRTHVAQ